MKRVLVFSLILIASFAFGQKVKMKKGKILVDKIEKFNVVEEGFSRTISTLDGKELFLIIYNSYEVPNPFPRSQSNTMTWTPYVNQYVSTIKFIDLKKEMTTKMAMDDVINSMIKSQIVNSDGTLNDELVDRYISKYDDENAKLLIR